MEHSSEPLLRPAVAQVRARLLVLQGEPLTALDLLAAANADGPLPPFLRVSTGLLESELWLGLGEPARARRRLAEIDSEDASDAAIGLARLELASGDPGAAIRAIATFLADERQPVLPFARAEGWAIDAIARDAVHDEDGALRALERALDLAEPRGYCRDPRAVRHAAALAASPPRGEGDGAPGACGAAALVARRQLVRRARRPGSRCSSRSATASSRCFDSSRR